MDISVAPENEGSEIGRLAGDEQALANREAGRRWVEPASHAVRGDGLSGQGASGTPARSLVRFGQKSLAQKKVNTRDEPTTGPEEKRRART